MNQEKETRYKRSHVFDYIYMKHPGKSDWCLPGGSWWGEEEEMGSDCVLDMGFPFGVMKISWN